MLVKVQEWLDKFSKWQELKKHALFSSIKLMQSEELDLMMVQEVIIKFKELCCKSLIKWMVLSQEVILKFLWQPTDQIL